jgi:L-alanine-DL-glutamate epimerase-like enolase superfamily enzyme
MKITNFDIRLVTIPLARPVEWSNVSEAVNEMLTLRIETDEGVFGLGQKKAHPVWAGMTARMMAHELNEVYLPMLRGLDPLRTEQIWDRIDRVVGWSATKSLIDITLHDLAARAAGLPMWKFLGGWQDEVEVMGFIARGPTAERIAAIGKQIETCGFRAYKIKIGTDERADCQFLRDLRKEVGDDFLIRVDANSGYTLDEAIRVSGRLADIGVLNFEDPCDLQGSSVRRQLYRRSALPVIVDNIIDSVRTAQDVLEEGAMGIALKVSRLGYRRARTIMEACREHGARVVAGSLTEGALGALSALHFYGAFRDFAWSPAEDSYYATLPDDVFERPSIVGGKVKLTNRPGISGDWIAEKLDRYSVRLTT